MTYAELLKNPDRITDVSWRELHEWVQQYPYVQGLRLLAVRKAKLEENSDFQPLLELAATYSPNRRYLYDFLQQPRQIFQQNTPVLAPDISTITPTSNTSENTVENTENQSVSTDNNQIETTENINENINENTIENINETPQEVVIDTTEQETVSQPVDDTEIIAENIAQTTEIDLENTTLETIENIENQAVETPIAITVETPKTEEEPLEQGELAPQTSNNDTEESAEPIIEVVVASKQIDSESPQNNSHAESNIELENIDDTSIEDLPINSLETSHQFADTVQLGSENIDVNNLVHVETENELESQVENELESQVENELENQVENEPKNQEFEENKSLETEAENLEITAEIEENNNNSNEDETENILLETEETTETETEETIKEILESNEDIADETEEIAELEEVTDEEEPQHADILQTEIPVNMEENLLDEEDDELFEEGSFIEDQEPELPTTEILAQTTVAANTQISEEPEEFTSFSDFLSFLNGEETIEKPTKITNNIPQKKQNIVDDFTEDENESLEDENAEEDVRRLARESVAESPAIISETLAKLLEMQEKYDKAIKMYEQLMHKYPEKSATFAAQITKIKNKR